MVEEIEEWDAPKKKKKSRLIKKNSLSPPVVNVVDEFSAENSVNSKKYKKLDVSGEKKG